MAAALTIRHALAAPAVSRVRADVEAAAIRTAAAALGLGDEILIDFGALDALDESYADELIGALGDTPNLRLANLGPCTAPIRVALAGRGRSLPWLDEATGRTGLTGLVEGLTASA